MNLLRPLLLFRDFIQELLQYTILYFFHCQNKSKHKLSVTGLALPTLGEEIIQASTDVKPTDLEEKEYNGFAIFFVLHQLWEDLKFHIPEDTTHSRDLPLFHHTILVRSGQEMLQKCQTVHQIMSVSN